MIGLIAIIIGFVGGVVGRAWKFENAHHRLVAFFVPLTICALLLHVPLLMDAAHTGFGGANAEKLNVGERRRCLLWYFRFWSLVPDGDTRLASRLILRGN